MSRAPLLLLICIVNLFAGVDPSEVKLKVMAAYMSRSNTCDSPIQIFTSTIPEFANFLVNPVLGSLENTKGTYNGSYPCIVFKMSEVIKFRSTVTTGNCTADTTYQTSICDSGITTTGVDGSESSCTSDQEDTVYMYISTLSTATTLGSGVNPFSPPSSTNVLNGVNLGSAFSISTDEVGKFIVNAYGKVISQGGTCVIQLPIFSFRQD